MIMSMCEQKEQSLESSAEFGGVGKRLLWMLSISEEDNHEAWNR